MKAKYDRTLRRRISIFDTSIIYYTNLYSLSINSFESYSTVYLFLRFKRYSTILRQFKIILHDPLTERTYVIINFFARMHYYYRLVFLHAFNSKEINIATHYNTYYQFFFYQYTLLTCILQDHREKIGKEEQGRVSNSKGINVIPLLFFNAINVHVYRDLPRRRKRKKLRRKYLTRLVSRRSITCVLT